VHKLGLLECETEQKSDEVQMSDEHKLATATEEAQSKTAAVSPTYVTYERFLIEGW
jgi:hypothetical protein